jgi:hypothetical protein
VSEKLIVGVYHSLEQAEKAVAELDKHGFPVAHVSIVAKDFGSKDDLSSQMTQTAHKTYNLKDWFAARFKWILSRPHFAAYEKHFHAENFLLVAHGTQDQIAWAWAIVRETGYVDADVHDEQEEAEL